MLRFHLNGQIKIACEETCVMKEAIKQKLLICKSRIHDYKVFE